MKKEPITEHILVKIIVKYPQSEDEYECHFDIDSMFQRDIVSSILKGHVQNAFKMSDWVAVKGINEWCDGKYINRKGGKQS